jgi:hypothetical protein
MTTIAILPESSRANRLTWRAVAGEKEAIGSTAGEALDAMTGLLSDDENSALVIIQRLRPDTFFTSEQRRRLEELMANWKAARDEGGEFGSNEQSELETLVEAELEGAKRRAETILHELTS